MAFQLQVTMQDFHGAGRNGVLKGAPDQCPRCHRHVHPAYRFSVFVDVGMAPGVAQVMFQCVSSTCQEAFLSVYGKTNAMSPTGGGPEYVYRYSVPMAAQKGSFPDGVAAISPNFVLIYNQAMAAESQGLDQIVGIGLRKAVEFLIKDFCISERPNDAEAIKACLLGPCIDKYVSDPQIKEVAKRAVWLGNDETHYVRKWDSKDIGDLKTLVKLTVNWIDSALTTKAYLTSMPTSGPAAAPPANP